jgi:hypothetical protein
MAVSSRLFYAKRCARLLILAAGFDRFTQPLHRKLNICGLQIAPAFNLGLVSILG